MNITLHDSWQTYLKEELEKPYFKNLVRFLDDEYLNQTCYPKEAEIFNAFNNCLFDDLKVVLIGQDPYHGPGQAHGLSFSVNEGIKHPPSLMNIFKEIQNDLGKEYPESGNLISWSRQGVLLLNATLTVRAHEAGSHQQQGWETFTDNVIKLISNRKSNVVFLLWGGFAKKKAKLIDAEKHCVLTTGHPSPLSANRGLWFGNNHFSLTNQYLEKSNLKPIKW